MSDLTAKVTKDSKGSIVVEGYEALKYNFHFDTPVFDTKHGKLAEIYERWQRVLIVIDTSESLCEGGGRWGEPLVAEGKMWLAKGFRSKRDISIATTPSTFMASPSLRSHSQLHPPDPSPFAVLLTKS